MGRTILSLVLLGLAWHAFTPPLTRALTECTCSSVGSVSLVAEGAAEAIGTGRRPSAAPRVSPTSRARPVYNAGPNVGANVDSKAGAGAKSGAARRLANAGPLDRTPYMFTSERTAQKATSLLYDKKLKGTFVCACTNSVPPPTQQYIISVEGGSQTSGRACIDTDTMDAVCTVLSDLDLMTCMTVWRSGAAGPAHPASIETGTLVDVATREMRRQGGPCARTIAIRLTEDSVLLPP